MKDGSGICSLPARGRLLQEELHSLCCGSNGEPPGHERAKQRMHRLLNGLDVFLKASGLEEVA